MQLRLFVRYRRIVFIKSVDEWGEQFFVDIFQFVRAGQVADRNRHQDGHQTAEGAVVIRRQFEQRKGFSERFLNYQITATEMVAVN